MPQLIVIALAGAGLYAGYKWARREWLRAAEAAERVAAEVRRATEAAAADPQNRGALEWDEAAGVYRPPRASGETA